METTPIADQKDQNDDRIARWGRSRNEGYRKFKHNFQQPAPMLFTQDHHPLWLADTYRGRSAFLVAGGPSFLELDRSKLKLPGVVTMGINNSVKTHRPNMWVCVDCPDHFLRSIWLDPTIQKFVPIDHASKLVFDSDRWAFTDMKVGDCPNVVYYKRNEHFQARQYLTEDCFNWGNHKKYGGGRSVLLVAVRLLYLLGFRRVYLLGVDFEMSESKGYHFEQARAKGAVKGNNDTYQLLQERFLALRPVFDEAGYQVFNCNPRSKLTAFDHVPFADAVEEALSHMDGIDVAKERTAGLYDTKTEDKAKGVGK